MHFEETTGAVHVGQNSMVFYDSEGIVGQSFGGKDIMASSVGKIQIGTTSTDVTSFVGEVHVPEMQMGIAQITLQTVRFTKDRERIE